MRNDLDKTVAAFADAVLQHFVGAGSWTIASARVLPQARDVWFGLPQLPTSAELAPVWSAQLKAHGLMAQRVANRN